MKTKRWTETSKLFMEGNPIAVFIWATNKYSLSFAQHMLGEQKDLIKYLNEKEKELVGNKK